MSSRRQAGITMFEVLVVMGIFVLVSGFALLFTMDSFRGSTFHGDRDVFVSLLQRARAQSMSNMCTATGCTDGQPHGVAIVGNTYILFEGSSYATRSTGVDAVFNASGAVTRSGDTEVVFSQLAGTTTLQKTYTFNYGGILSVITIETNGRIWWTN